MSKISTSGRVCAGWRATARDRSGLDFLAIALDRFYAGEPAPSTLDCRQATFADKPGQVLGAVACTFGHLAEWQWDGIGGLDRLKIAIERLLDRAADQIADWRMIAACLCQVQTMHITCAPFLWQQRRRVARAHL